MNSSANILDHALIRASAGTGKTYRLTNRYLSLISAGVEPYSILATTFTRKAAGEILARVLKRLADSVLNPQAAAELQSAIALPGHQPDFAQMLRQVCDQLHMLNISTLDSFFSSIAQAYRLELELPSDIRIVDDKEPMAQRIADESIESVLADGELSVLLELLQYLQGSDTKRSVTDIITRAVAGLRDVYQRAPDQATWQQYSIPGQMSESQFHAALDALRTVDLKAHGKRVQTAVSKHVDQLTSEDFEGFLKGGLAKKLLEDDDTFYSKPIPEEIATSLTPLIAYAKANLIEAHQKKTLATYQLLKSYTNTYQSKREQQRIYLFSDLPDRLAAFLQDPSSMLTTDLYFRLDSQIHHLLLDEFQDTSPAQWSILEPIASEIRMWPEGDRSIFVVGDVKQAIYGWRGGCAELFDKVETDLAITPESLNHSWRSAQPVLDCVNQVFSQLSTSPALDNFPIELIATWQNRFADHTSARTELPGYVTLQSTLPKTDADNDTDEEMTEDELQTLIASGGSSHLVHVAEQIKELYQRDTARTIGVLVRRNSTVSPLLQLLQGMLVPATGEAGAPATDQPAVLCMLSAMRLADHPGDQASAFHVLNSPLAAVVGLSSLSDVDRRNTSRHIREDLIANGYANVISRWSQQIAGECDPDGASRLAQLVELAERYDGQATLRPTDFVEFVMQTPIPQAKPASVRVMTIHKSKGLEFDVVVLPELDVGIAGLSQQPAYEQKTVETGPTEAVYAKADQTLRQMYPPIEEAYQCELRRRFNDDLCALYVAMTRAKYAMHLFVKPVSLKKNGEFAAAGWTDAKMSTLLRRALSVLEEKELPDGRQVLCEFGDPDWWEPLGNDEADQFHELDAALTPYSIQCEGSGATRGLRRIAPSGLEGGRQLRAADLLGVPQQEGQLRGSVIHAWFELVGWLDEAKPDVSTLLHIARQSYPDVEIERLTEWQQEFADCLKQPNVVAALSKPTVTDGEMVTLWRERAFVSPRADSLMQGIFDRVVIRYRDDMPIAANLTDFKTDRISRDQLAARTAHYEPQLRAYREALKHLLRLNSEQISTSLLFIELDELVTV